jgi:predicted Zn-dependent protease
MYNGKIMRLILITLCAAILASCTGQSFDQEGGDLKRSEVEFISAKMRGAIEQEHPLLKHKLVVRYVDALGQAMVSRNQDMPPLPYEFRVLRTNSVLAFSLPGGIVYVSLGLLRAVELEGQLAAAIAHELAHQQLSHPLLAWRRRVNASRGRRYALDFSGGWKGNFLGERGALFLDKGMEEEADRLGPLIQYKAGFDPRIYLSYLEILRKRELDNAEDVAALLSLHPPLQKRLGWAKEGIMKLPPRKDPNPSSLTFQQIKAILKETARKTGKAQEKKELQ